ncbi:substrate-binding domain-containing protein [Desulfatitalea tepidiphila]|uniref:substrate-binding domain-containing protein n=1 Tax=Desulfatitalea tepidiphila TaxID=1185843 RepID=UPI0006B4E45B|nr:substrate-binding domain-containing protein [Desulfatitalea tepidiphila]
MRHAIFPKKTWVIFGIFVSFATLAFARGECTQIYGDGAVTIRLATGSPGELGLIEVLAKAFNKTHDTRLCWNKAGSGASLKLLKDKAVDFIMVHAPAAEKQAVAEGWATKRHLIGSNEFFIVGPENDPAGISSATSAADAYARIARAKAPFFSRGDNSGTHKKELAIWSKAAIEPSGDWYLTTLTFMMATLKMADEKQGYFMTDSSTWVAARKELKNLKVLFRGDPFLINTYHTLCQPSGATPGQALAAAFIDFVISDQGQKIIREYGAELYGEGLYNDAEYARQYDH